MACRSVTPNTPVTMDLLLWPMRVSPSYRNVLERRWLSAQYQIAQAMHQTAWTKRIPIKLADNPLHLRTTSPAQEGFGLLTLMAPYALAITGTVVVIPPSALKTIDALQYHAVHEAVSLLAKSLTHPQIRQSQILLTIPETSQTTTAVLSMHPGLAQELR